MTQLMCARPSKHCGCPEEEILIGAAELLIHYEDGRADVYLDWGDDGAATASFPANTQFAGRASALRWAKERANEPATAPA